MQAENLGSPTGPCSEKRAPRAGMADVVDRSSIERNANGEEEAHSADPELWNFDGTEVDLSDGHKYKMGKQLWYIQDRAKDAIKAGKPVAGQPMNEKARKSGKSYNKED